MECLVAELALVAVDFVVVACLVFEAAELALESAECAEDAYHEFSDQA